MHSALSTQHSEMHALSTQYEAAGVNNGMLSPRREPRLGRTRKHKPTGYFIGNAI